MVKNKIITCLMIVASLMVASLMRAPSLLASASAGEARNALTGIDESAYSGKDVPGTITIVINTMLYIVGVLAVAMIIFSGIRYITAHGDKQQVESAKNTLIYSVVGLVIAIIAYAIVNYVIGRFDQPS